MKNETLSSASGNFFVWKSFNIMYYIPISQIHLTLPCLNFFYTTRADENL